MTQLQAPSDRPSDVPPSLPERRAARRLWAGGAGVVLGGLLLVWQFPWLGRSTELVDLWKISEGSALGAAVWVIALLAMTSGWLLAMRAARGLTFGDAWLPIASVTLVLLAIFIAVYPATAIDAYIYAARSHLLTDHGLNPSTVTPERLWLIDPYVHYASREWGDDTSPYGPLWNLIAAPATALDGESIGTAVLLLKVTMAAAVLGVGALVYSIARAVQPEWALAALVGWLWCPIVLWEGIANGHNDVVLTLLLVAALWCWIRRHEGGVIPLLGAAALLKVVSVILLPAAVVAIVVRIGWTRRLLVVTLQTACLSLGALWIAFAPFYDLAGTIEAIQSQRDVRVTSPALLVSLLLSSQQVDIDFALVYERFSTGVILLLTLAGVAAAWRRPDWLPRIAWEQLFWFMLLATSNLRPWYVIWLIALALVLPIGWPFVRAAAWSTGALLAYLYTAWIQNWTDPTLLERTAINLAITLGPVLVVKVWEGVRLLRREPAASSPATGATPIPEA